MNKVLYILEQEVAAAQETVEGFVRTAAEHGPSYAIESYASSAIGAQFRIQTLTPAIAAIEEGRMTAEAVVAELTESLRNDLLENRHSASSTNPYTNAQENVRREVTSHMLRFLVPTLQAFSKSE